MSFNEARFIAQVEKSLATCRQILGNNKNPTYSTEVGHQWVDKYILAEVLTNTFLSSSLGVLEVLGVSARTLKTVRGWVDDEKRSVTFRLRAEERCVFDREETREEDSKTKHVTTWSAAGGAPLGKRTDKLVHTITDYFWKFSVEWSLVAFFGNDPDDAVVLQSRSGEHEIRTAAKSNPRVQALLRDRIDLNGTWLLQQLDENNSFRFRIDRASDECHTPRRNAQVEEAFKWTSEWLAWVTRVRQYFVDDLFSAHADHGLDTEAALNADSVFVPVVPLMVPSEEQQDDAGDELIVWKGLAGLAPQEGAGGPVLPPHDVAALLAEEQRSLSEKCAELGRAFPEQGVVTAAEAIVVVACQQGEQCALAYVDGMMHIEEVLRQQLVAAIGKCVSTQDFAEYMVFHGRRLFKEQYAPKPFCYAVRRPDHHPEGIVSIEAHPADGSMAEPIHTVVNVSPIAPSRPFSFQLHSAAEVAFSGECAVHGWLDHVFAGESSMRLTLNARARQFSSFLVLVGRINGPGLFDPQYGVIVQNKTEVSIPLESELIPAAGEFRDAIESLSDEQQRFAQAYRGMQLASTLFGVCVIQIKPQLEKLLKLPNDSLTKEIRLTQDVLQMFIKYQIPSDLLSFGGDADVADAAKVEAVQKHVKAMQDMINASKHKEIAEKRQKAEYDQATVAAVPKKKKRFFRARNKFGKKKQTAPAGGSSGSGSSNNNNNNAVAPPEAVAEDNLTASTQFEGDEDDGGDDLRDLLAIPRELDERFEALDEDRALRPTILNVGQTWDKHEQVRLLGDPVEKVLSPVEQKLEKEACYDLLDALSKSGCLPVEGASLHVMVAASHVFAESVMDTLVQKNANPIEKVERSQLILASTIHQVAPSELILNDQEAARVQQVAPKLFQLENQ